jgi:phosphoribosylamine--glycine ligase
MKILLIGSGGRENCLADKLVNSGDVELYAAPGNPGILNFAKFAEIDINNFIEVSTFCKNERIDFVVIGPEQPLAMGIVDFLEERGILVFGPSKKASEIESSKSFAKNLMRTNNIPTANFSVFNKEDIDSAISYIADLTYPIVIKADGLAAGKGVIIAGDFEEAKQTIEEIFYGAFAEAGNKIIIEEYLQGEEASIFVLTDGDDYIILPSSQDHKRIGEGDTGKNTGGMGAYSPAPIVNSNVLQKIELEIIKPTLQAMKQSGRKFKGCLYAGLMIANDSPKVIEFNCRFGDPETQAVLQLIEGNFAQLLFSIAKGQIKKEEITLIENKFASCVVIASKGYPDKFNKGYEIFGIDNLQNDSIIYHSGTKKEGNKILTNGGRVLCVVSVADNLAESLDKNYRTIEKIDFEGKYFRKDIGKKGLLKL